MVVDELDSREEGVWCLTQSKLCLMHFVFLYKSIKEIRRMEAGHDNIDPAKLKLVNARD